MNGYCAQCLRSEVVDRHRIVGLGLRWLCTRCVAWMASVGMAVEYVGAAEPRMVDRGVDSRRLRGRSSAQAFVPEWRQRSLVRDLARRVLA